MSVETSFNDRKPCFREIGAAASDGSNSILLHSHQSPTLPHCQIFFFFLFSFSFSCIPFENHFVCRGFFVGITTNQPLCAECRLVLSGFCIVLYSTMYVCMYIIYVAEKTCE